MIYYGVVAFRTIGEIRTTHDRDDYATAAAAADWHSPKAPQYFWTERGTAMYLYLCNNINIICIMMHMRACLCLCVRDYSNIQHDNLMYRYYDDTFYYGLNGGPRQNEQLLIWSENTDLTFLNHKIVFFPSLCNYFNYIILFYCHYTH